LERGNDTKGKYLDIAMSQCSATAGTKVLHKEILPQHALIDRKQISKKQVRKQTERID
jgi:hypothetical protein